MRLCCAIYNYEQLASIRLFYCKETNSKKMMCCTCATFELDQLGAEPRVSGFVQRRPRLMTQPTSWQRQWDDAQSTLSIAERSLASTTSPVASRILRVGQLDAELLDVELVNLLRDPLSKALGLVNVCPPRLTNLSWLYPPGVI